MDGDLHEGGCLCGEVRYSVAGEPRSFICHCASCRRAAGAPSIAWLTFPASGFSFVSGEPAAHRSSAPVVRTHCGACGTSLTYTHGDTPGAIDVTTASMDSPEAFPPTHRVWMDDRVAWDRGDDGLPSFGRGSSSE